MLKYYIPEYLWLLNDATLNPIEWLQSVDLSEEQKESEFGGRYHHYQRVKTISQTDVFMAPFFVNDYISQKRLNFLKIANKEASAHNRKLVLWIKGDYDFRLNFKDAIVIIQGPDLNDKHVMRFAGPVEIRDNVDKSQLSQPSYWIKKNPKPNIGFVGQARSERLLFYFLKGIIWYFSYILHFTARKPPPVIPHIILRKKALNNLMRSEYLNTNFVLRKRFLGLSANKEEKTEYLENIKNNAYTLCVRGTGNFSFRFYDTLSHGRIPILIDTKCVLPFPDQIDWEKLIVIVPRKKMNQLTEYILEYHQKLSEDDFIQRQMDLRTIWERYLKREAYYYQLSLCLKGLAIES